MDDRITLGRRARRAACYALVFGCVGPLVGGALLALLVIFNPVAYLAALVLALMITFPWPSLVGLAVAFLPRGTPITAPATALIGALGGYGIYLTMPVFWPHLAEALNHVLIMIPLSMIAAIVCSWLARRFERWAEHRVFSRLAAGRGSLAAAVPEPDESEASAQERSRFGRRLAHIFFYAVVFNLIGPAVGTAVLLVGPLSTGRSPEPLILEYWLLAVVLGWWVTFPWPLLVGVAAAFLPVRGRRAYGLVALIGLAGGVGVLWRFGPLSGTGDHSAPAALLLFASGVAAIVSLFCARRTEAPAKAFHADWQEARSAFASAARHGARRARPS